MSTRHFAAIDLGTNTFHLLIAAVQNGHWAPVYQEEVFVKLGRAGTHTLSEEAVRDGLAILESFKLHLENYQVQATIAAGTAALRTATNGPAFASKAEQILGVPPQIIIGDQEATLIFKGVQSSIPQSLNSYWLMDIGGGSVEFIQVDHGILHWKSSFPIGNALLTRAFHHSDPISENHILQLLQFLDSTLEPLWQVWPTHAPILVGAAGTFDVIAHHCMAHGPWRNFNAIDLLRWQEFYHKVIASTREERIAFTHIPDERVDYIVSAFLLVQYILEKGKVHAWYSSTHSLKEGLMETLVQQHHAIL